MNPALAKLGHQLVLGDQLTVHVSPTEPATVDQQNWLGLHQPGRPCPVIGGGVHRERPEHNRRHQDQSIGQALIVRRHAVLCRVRDEDEDEEVSRTRRSTLSREEAQQSESDEIDDRSSDEELDQR
jgi:hypothetical protein